MDLFAWFAEGLKLQTTASIAFSSRLLRKGIHGVAHTMTLLPVLPIFILVIIIH